MDPVTHTLAGAVLARSGLNRLSAYSTVAMAIGAEFPDIDTGWSLLGPVTGFQHHRGITHTLLGIPFEAAILVAAFWCFDRWRRSGRREKTSTNQRASGSSAAAPPRWGFLYGLILLALLSHIGLDWTNNYGVRPFFPFDAHWHAGSILFIVDPLLLLILTAALALPVLFRLIGSEIGARAPQFAPRRWAIGALGAIVAMLTLRSVEHSRAMELVSAETVDISESSTAAGGSTLLTARKVEASPDPFSPFRWHGAADFGPFLQLQEIDTARGVVSPNDERLDKPADSATLQAALRSRLGQVYLDWSPMPALGISNGSNNGPGAGGAANAVVFFRDPRFMGAVPLLDRGGIPPLTGTVEVDASSHVIDQRFDGRQERSPR